MIFNWVCAFFPSKENCIRDHLSRLCSMVQKKSGRICFKIIIYLPSYATSRASSSI